MSKRKTTTITERFDDSGNIYERVTTTIEEEGFLTFEPAPDTPSDPSPGTTPAWPAPNTPYDPWWTRPQIGDPITNPTIIWTHTEPSIETVHTVYCNSDTGETIHEYSGQ